MLINIFWGILLIFLLPDQGGAVVMGKIPIAVTIMPQAYFVERLGGNHVDVMVMIPKGVSPETYEPTPRQLISLSKAIIYVKIGHDVFPAEKKYLNILDKNAAKVKVVSFNESIKHLKDDPHIWLSPSAVKKLSREIYQTLVQIDPAHKHFYEGNLLLFLKDIEDMERRIKAILAGKEGKTFLVYHPAWGHFAAEFGLKQLAIEKEGKTVSASDLRKTIDTAKDKEINVVFVQKGFDTKSARSVALELKGKIMETDPLEKDWLNNLKHFAEILRDTLR
jgi:zinc transport system substrate-binding protein